MELAVDGLPLLVDQFEGVRAIAIHVPKTIGDAPVTKQKWDLVGWFRSKSEEVPEHVNVLNEKEVTTLD